MKEQHIDLLVERLQGTFPTSKISPKAVVGTWRKDKILQDFPDELGMMLRERLQENCTDFPSLREVQFHAKRLLPRATEGVCHRCQGVGYLPELDQNGGVIFRHAYAKKVRELDGSPMLMTWQRTPTSVPEPVEYAFVTECRCRKQDVF